MFKRFLRHNRMLAAVLAVSAVAVLVLFVVLIIQYIDMSRTNAQVEEMVATIEDLQNTRKHKNAAVQGNLERFAQDKEFYSKKLVEMKSYFGCPYYDAVDAMAKLLDKKIETEEEDGTKKTTVRKYNDGNELIADFRAFVEKDAAENAKFRLRRFAREYGAAWDEAMKVFIEKANKASFEEINSDNCEEFFIVAAGYPRDRWGVENRTGALVKDMQGKMKSYLTDKEIVVRDEAFALNSEVADKQGIIDTMFNMDIVGYLVECLGEAKYSIKSLENLTFEGNSEDRKVQNLKIAKYKLVINGDLLALREFTARLNQASNDRRFFKIKKVKLFVPEVHDEGAKIIQVVENKGDSVQTASHDVVEDSPFGSDRRSSRRRDRDSEEEQSTSDADAVDVFDESELPYYERSTYGELVLGGTDDVSMELELEYYYFAK